MLPVRKLTIASMLLIVALAGCGGAATSHDSHPTSSSKKQDASVLFSQSADSGTIRSAGRDRWVLTLKGVARQTVWFQDRPGRAAGQQSTRDFVRGWSNAGFAGEPPNAALTLLDADADADTLVVELVSRPRYDAGRDTISYTVRVVESALGAIRSFHGDQGIPKRFKAASLFIDSATVPQPIFYGNTFAADTKVLMADGSLKAIGDVVVRDSVMSLDASGNQTPAPVTFSAQDRNDGYYRPSMVYLQLGDSEFITTVDTVFPDGTRADHLVPGDELEVMNGKQAVTRVSLGEFRGPIAHIAVGGPTGLFYAEGVLVHGFGK